VKDKMGLLLRKLIMLFNLLTIRRRAFRTYGGYPHSDDVWQHTTWWRIFSKRHHGDVRKVK